MFVETNATELNESAEQRAPLRASYWLWRPWYAKLWWAAIPLYWIGAAASLKVEFLEAFYTSALAGFLNIFFVPFTALMVLGLGFAREWLGPIEWGRSHPRYGHSWPDVYSDERNNGFRRRYRDR